MISSNPLHIAPVRLHIVSCSPFDYPGGPLGNYVVMISFAELSARFLHLVLSGVIAYIDLTTKLVHLGIPLHFHFIMVGRATLLTTDHFKFTWIGAWNTFNLCVIRNSSAWMDIWCITTFQIHQIYLSLHFFEATIIWWFMINTWCSGFLHFPHWEFLTTQMYSLWGNGVPRNVFNFTRYFLYKFWLFVIRYIRARKF